MRETAKKLSNIDKLIKYQKTAVEESRLKIPVIYGRDVILGHNTVLPIPLAMAAAFDAQQVKDLFGFEMISQNKFTTAQIDKNTWTKDMLDLLMEFIERDERAADYRGLDWSQEYEYAANGDPNDTQSAL